MSTPRKPWPHSAMFARDAAAIKCQQTLRAIQPLLNHSDLEVVARVAHAINHTQNALRLLESVGAVTVPDGSG